jgi:polar amino acid transport system substrate-binding protein
MKKKLMASLLVLTMVIGMTACGNAKKDAESDVEYIKNKGTLIVGITDFAPMDYKD